MRAGRVHAASDDDPTYRWHARGIRSLGALGRQDPSRASCTPGGPSGGEEGSISVSLFAAREGHHRSGVLEVASGCCFAQENKKDDGTVGGQKTEVLQKGEKKQRARRGSIAGIQPAIHIYPRVFHFRAEAGRLACWQGSPILLVG